MLARARLAVWFSLVLCLAVLLPASSAYAAPARVYAGVYLHDVSKLDQKDGVFDVDLDLWVKWLGEFDPETLALANAAQVERTLLGKETDGSWHSARWRVKGTLRGEFPVQRFPFDMQTLAIVLELPDQAGDLVPDLAGSGMRERFSVTGWLYDPSFVPRVGAEVYRSDLGSIAAEGRPTSVHRVAFEVTLRRPLLTAATKLFLPLLVILLVALVALFVHPKELEVRASVGVTALLACFAFQFAVADTMPNVAYVTLADVLFLISYALTAVLLVVSVIAFALHERGRARAWKILDISTLACIPFLILSVALFAVRTAPPPPAVPVASLDGKRPVSARPLLRIGTNSLVSASGGLVGRGANWGTVRTEPDGTRVAVLVEEVPSITNDSLRFLADGTLSVTWRLRQNLTWSDGQPLTAGDLKFALEVSPDSRIVEVLVKTPRDIVVRFRDRVAAALESIIPLPRHALEAEFKKGGYEAVRVYRRTHPTPSAGPYHVVEFVAESHAVLEANPHFVGPPPSIARIEIRRYADDPALVRAFETGEVDMLAPNAIGPEAAESLAKRRPDAVAIRPSELQVALHPDLAHPLLGRLDIRRAILSAVDRERMLTSVFGAAATAARVSHVPVPGALPSGTVVVAYDPAAARKVFEAAGAIGAAIPLFCGRTAVEKAIAAYVAKDVAAAGLTLVVTEVASTADLYRSRKHGGLLLRTSSGERDALAEKYWSLPQTDGKFARAFRSEAYDDGVAALVEREERALYPERREQIRDLLFVAYSQRLPNIPLLFLADRTVAVADLDGWEEGTGAAFATTIERWFFKPVDAAGRK